jgi:hypothetical protein
MNIAHINIDCNQQRFQYEITDSIGDIIFKSKTVLNAKEQLEIDL